MRVRAHAVPGVLALLVVAACEKPPAPKPDDTPALKPIEPASATAATTASAPATADTPAPTAVAVAAVDAGKPTAATSGTTKTTAVAAALKPAAAHIGGKNFALDVASPGCKAGDDCTMTIKLSPDGAFHVNKEYPYKFLASAAPNVTYLGKADPNTFTRAAGDFAEQNEKSATMTVRFKPSSAGETHVAGKYKLSVCSAEQCQIEEAMVDLPVSVL